MATLAVFLYPEKIGIARVKSPGSKPSYSSVQWRVVENAGDLLDEPLMLATLIREMVGDQNTYNIYLNVWPGAYSEVMFSYSKKGKGDLKRLRQSELETVFHGELNTIYSTDLILNNGKVTSDGKCHRIILNIKRNRAKSLLETFRAQKMKLQRIAPMDVTAAMGALRFWAPKDKTISVCMTLDEGCTSIAFMRNGVLHAMRTIQNGFSSILANYEHVMGMDHDACLDLIRTNGVEVSSEQFDVSAIQDDVLRMLNRITVETIRTLHNTFGDDAVIDQILLCGNFVTTTGLVEHLNSVLDAQCAIAGADTLKAGACSAIVLDDKDLQDMFPLAATTDKGTDLLYEMKKNKSDKISSVVFCAFLTIIVGGLMAITPRQVAQLEQQRDIAADLINQPEYVAVSDLLDRRAEVSRQKEELIDAIENLPHGATNTAGIIEDLYNITTEYGTVTDIKVDYASKTIQLTFLTSTYETFVYWQQELVDGGRFSFNMPPEFNGTGLSYTVSASMTAADFEAVEEIEEVETTEAASDSTEGMG